MASCPTTYAMDSLLVNFVPSTCHLWQSRSKNRSRLRVMRLAWWLLGSQEAVNPQGQPALPTSCGQRLVRAANVSFWLNCEIRLHGRSGKTRAPSKYSYRRCLHLSLSLFARTILSETDCLCEKFRSASRSRQHSVGTFPCRENTIRRNRRAVQQCES